MPDNKTENASVSSITEISDAELDRVTGGSKIGEAAQQVSGLFKAASDIGQAGKQAATDPVADLIHSITTHQK